MQMFNFSKEKQLFFTFIIFGLLLSTFYIFISKSLYGGKTEELALNNASKIVLKREKTFQGFIKHSEDILYSLRELNSFKDYINNPHSHNNEIINDFLAYTKAHHNFMQLRFIDKNGLEKIRLERKKEDGEIIIIPKEELQNKSNRYYFKNAKTKSLEKVYFSSLDLNIEHGKVEKPYKPTLRVILPIKQKEEFAGILIINYFMEGFLEKITSSPLYDTILFNDKGYTLKHYKQSNSWGFYNENKHTISDELKFDYKEILKKDVFRNEYFVIKKLDLPINNGINILLKLKDSYLEKVSKREFHEYITISFFIIFASVILAFIIIKKFGKILLNTEELNKINIELENASKIAKIGFWEHTNDEKISWTKGLYQIFDIEDFNQEITSSKFYSYINKEDKQLVKKEFDKSVEDKKELFFTYEIITEKGINKFIETRGKHFYNNGKYEKTIGSVYDVTSKKELEKKELKNRQFIESFIENTNAIVTIIDDTGRMIKLNKTGRDFSKYSEEEISSEVYFWKVLIPEDIRVHITSFIEDAKNDKLAKIYENPWISKDGEIKTFQWANTVIKKENNQLDFIVSIGIDITHKKILETQSRLASMGQMIGNIAHQWRQPLNLITTHVTTMKLKSDFDDLSKDDIEECSKEVVKQAAYLSSTIDNFRNFIKGNSSFSTISIKEVLESSLNLVLPSIKNAYITLIKNIDDDVELDAIRSELEEAFINILNNSKDILVENIKDDSDRLLFIETKKIEDSSIEIRIFDSGGGFKNNIEERIFEPYFTTKHESMGTGLGLSIVDKIIREKHNGTILAYNKTFNYNNKQYKGACFSINLKK